MLTICDKVSLHSAFEPAGKQSDAFLFEGEPGRRGRSKERRTGYTEAFRPQKRQRTSVSAVFTLLDLPHTHPLHPSSMR